MSDNYREIEIKLHVPDLDVVRERLEAADATLVSPRIYERNIRYDNAAHTMVRQGVILRLRQDSRARLTFKAPGMTNVHGLYERYEAEVEVSDFETMDVILTRLGYVPSMIYEKYRTTYMLHGAEVVLDEMPYGSFVEIEGDEVSIPYAVAQLALSEAVRYNAGYAALFENVRRNLGLSFRDLTFANFSGILVPEHAFKTPEL
jgi:adenylate cyclase class 2